MSFVSNSSDQIYFSIIMPNYNMAKYIVEAINSVVTQRYPFWELVIVDDCSTDDSIKKIEPFLKNERIKLIKHKKNLGIPYTLTDAIKNTSYNIIGILDSDDTLHFDALNIMAKAYHENPDCGFIYSTHWICDENLKNEKICTWIKDIEPGDSNIYKLKASAFKTFRKETYNKTFGFNLYFKAAEDYDLILKLEEVTKFKFVNEPLYYVRVHKGGITRDKKKRFKIELAAYIAKNNASFRRLKLNLPTLSIENLYIEYYIITFYSLIKFFNKIMSFDSRLNKMFQRFSQKIKPIIIKFFLKIKTNTERIFINS